MQLTKDASKFPAFFAVLITVGTLTGLFVSHFMSIFVSSLWFLCGEWAKVGKTDNQWYFEDQVNVTYILSKGYSWSPELNGDLQTCL